MRAYNFGGSWRPRNLMKLYQVMQVVARVITWTLVLQGIPHKISEGKNVQNSARFSTTFDFDREYLRKGMTYRKSL